LEPGHPFRKTSQHLMPANRPPATAGQYDLYPGFPVGPGQIHLGFSALADRLAAARQVVIDGYPGVLMEPALMPFKPRHFRQPCLHQPRQDAVRLDFANFLKHGL
jgi:hypothetical protein